MIFHVAATSETFTSAPLTASTISGSHGLPSAAERRRNLMASRKQAGTSSPHSLRIATCAFATKPRRTGSCSRSVRHRSSVFLLIPCFDAIDANELPLSSASETIRAFASCPR